MIAISKNRFFDALLKLMIFSSFLHIGITLLYSILKKEVFVWNYFSIVGFNSLFPQIEESLLYFIFSAIFTIFVYILILIFFTRKNKTKNTKR